MSSLLSLWQRKREKNKAGRGIGEDEPTQIGGQSKEQPIREDYGLFHFEETAPDKHYTVDIIAVHGLCGDWEETWMDDNGKLWLRDFLPSQFPTARIMSYGYNSSVAFSKAITDIHDEAAMLLERLYGERPSKVEKTTPIIFIAHSLGGIVVKDALILAHQRSRYTDVLNSVIGLMFFAVPHRGSDIAYWASFAASLLNTVQLGFGTHKTFVKDLTRNSATFAHIAQQFVERAAPLQIRTFYETDKMGNQLIVDRGSALLNITNEIPTGIAGANHKTVCKFNDIGSNKYFPVWRALKGMMDSAIINSNIPSEPAPLAIGNVTPSAVVESPPPSKTKETDSVKRGDTHQYEKTYRAKGIPGSYDLNSTATLLRSILNLGDQSPTLQVQSLASNPYDESNQDAFQVATFTFTDVAKILSGSKEQWSFPIPKDENSLENLAVKNTISIDTNFEGFTPMNALPTEKHKIDCIAISGLGGHAFGSFKERKGSHVWLRDSLPRDLQGVRVLTYGYDTHLVDSDSFQDLEAIASSFRTAIRAITRHQRNTAAPRPLIFIAHSLGGLVLKEALIQMKDGTTADKVNLKSTYGALFFGVPNQGIDISSLIPMAEGQSNLPFLLTLGREGGTLRKLHHDFCSSFNFPDSIIISYYETKKSPTAKKNSEGLWTMTGEPAILVDTFSAIQSRPWENGPKYREAINRSHSELVKFSSHDEIYYRIRDQMQEFIEVAVDVIRARVSEHDSTTPSLVARPQTALEVKPFERNKGFVERGDQMGVLERKLTEPNSDRWIALYGLGGVGKSQIALEYAYRHIQKSPRTSFFWVHAANHARFEQSYRNIAKTANLSGLEDPKVDILTAVHDWLNSESSGYWLMVIDNADDASMFFRDVETSSDRVEAASDAGKTLFECIPRTSKGSIIYTTRSRAAAVNLTGVGSIMPIESMSPTEAEILLRNKFGSEGLDKKETSDLLIELAYLPLAISQAAAFMKCTEQSISEYLKAFRENDREKEDLLSHEFIDCARDLRSSNAVLKTWRMSFNNIQKDDPRAADLLSVMSFMDRQSIPRYLLLGESESIGKFGRAMGTLTAFSLVTANSSNTMFNFHRLVHLCTRDWLRLHNEQDKWSKRALELVSTHFPDGTHENKDICAELLPHAEAALLYDNGKHANDSARAKLLHNTGVYYLTRGLYPEAYRNVSEGLAIRKEALGLHDRDTLTSSGKLASVLRHQGKYKEAEDMTQEVLKEREEALGKDDADTLTSVSDLAEVLWYENKYEEAKEANQRALEARERLLPKEHLDTLTSITIEGYLLRHRGMYDEAEAMHRRALNGRGLALGPEHPDTLSSMNNLAYVMRCQERYAAAQEMYQRVLDVRQRVLGPDHPDTLTSATNVAYMLKFQLNFQEAERMYRQILETRRRVLGDDHPKTLKGMKNLYWVLRYQGKEEAHTMNPEAWEAIE